MRVHLLKMETTHFWELSFLPIENFLRWIISTNSGIILTPRSKFTSCYHSIELHFYLCEFKNFFDNTISTIHGYIYQIERCFDHR